MCDAFLRFTQEKSFNLLFSLGIEFNLLFFGKTIGDGDMAFSFGVDARHFASEELSVRGCVFPLINSDIVMYHLMDDGILNEFLRQVKTRIDTKDEVLVSQRSKEP